MMVTGSSLKESQHAIEVAKQYRMFSFAVVVH